MTSSEIDLDEICGGCKKSLRHHCVPRHCILWLKWCKSMVDHYFKGHWEHADEFRTCLRCGRPMYDHVRHAPPVPFVLGEPIEQRTEIRVLLPAEVVECGDGVLLPADDPGEW
ncbi:MAG: hypothetical protein WED34_11620 [Planctomycetales bacterium]